MNLSQTALRRPLTVVMIGIAIALASVAAWRRMPKDIFPPLDLPTIYVAQAYGGMDPAQMEGFLTYYFEYHFLYLTGIEHVESKSIQGAALIKLQFHPGTDTPVCTRSNRRLARQYAAPYCESVAQSRRISHAHPQIAPAQRPSLREF